MSVFSSQIRRCFELFTANIFSGLLAAVVSPYFYGVVYLQYYDLKLHKAM